MTAVALSITPLSSHSLIHMSELVFLRAVQSNIPAHRGVWQEIRVAEETPGKVTLENGAPGGAGISGYSCP